ncbi:rhodanese-like domain-containing protein [Sulfurimonas sp. CS5]|uniref:rhodanese-like domain-containing protein n=1 Tax=Sulfurimonas sp. CS5 TaxID=3391145 RepID=UPI0039ED427E
MTKILLSLIIFSISLFASMTNEYPSQKILDSKIPIVDIRTPGEWVETGIVKNSITIMFWDEKGGYDVNAFLTELNKKVDTKKPFALICRTGSRTSIVADFLAKKLHYDVVNILGGIVYLKAMKLKTVPYEK